MKRFRFLIAAMTLAALCSLVSCEKPKTEDEDKKDDGKEEITIDTEEYPYNENTWVIDGIENDLYSTALTMVGENLAIAASTEDGLTDVTDIMESDEFFYAEVSPALLNKEFNPKNEKSVFTLISTLSDVPMETVAPDKTDEIKDGKCLMTYEDNILTLKAVLILSDGTKAGLHITAKAKEEEEYHTPFSLKVYDITSVSATVEVEPYDTDAPYYMDIVTAADFAQAQIYGFDDYMTYLLETMETNTGKGRQEVIEMISSYGNDGFIVTTLTPDTDYVAVAVGINETGMTCTEVIFEAFTTLEPAVSGNVIEISASDITATAATINVSASNEDPYILAIEPSNCINGLTGEELADYIIQSNIAWGGLEQMTYSGNTQIGYEGKAGWKYSVIAFGYEGGAVTGDVTVYEMTMGEGGDPSACTFDFGFEVEEWEMYLNVTPSVNDVVYVCNIVKKSDLDVLTDVNGSEQGALAECLETLIEEMIVDCGSRERVVDLISIMGRQGFNIKYAYETEYVQWAVPVDQDGNPTAAFSVSEVFKTPAEAKSDASLSLVSYRVFDGTELAALRPSEFKTAKGYAVVELIVEPSETAAKWWSYIALDDLTDRTEQTIIKNILMAPTQEGATKQYVLSFWGTNTIMGVAQDAAGKYGPLLLEVIHLDQNNVTPATAL